MAIRLCDEARRLLRCCVHRRKPPILKGGLDGQLEQLRMAVFKNNGFCPICETETIFIAEQNWLRDWYFCSRCGSIPRERALMLVLSQRFPNWKDLTIHESSPGGRGASVKLSKECQNYIPSQFFERVPLGETYAGCRCENLEQLTFADGSIDIHVTQDVAEHILRPYRAFSEIARTLKPGGAHVFTVPLVRRHMPSVRRACPAGDGIITYFVEAEYHGNPISEQGSLVTTDWGYDIVKHIYSASGLATEIISIDCLDYGIRAEYIEVLVT